MKLNQKIRNDVVEAMTDKAFDPRRQKLSKARETLAQRLYNKCVDKKTRDLMETLSDAFVSRREHLYVQLTDGRRRRFKLERKLPFPAGWDWGKTHIVDDVRLCDAVYKLEADQSALDDESASFEAEASAILSRARSTEQLKELWPEAVAFLPKNEQLALVADVQKLNKVLAAA